MANIIHFKKEEKLAILRIMVEINNHYRMRFPNPFNYIENVSTFLGLFNGVSESYNISNYEAKIILIENFKTRFSEPGVYDNDRMFIALLREMLHNSNYGVFSKTNSYKDKELLAIELVEEWNFIFSLLKGYVKPSKDCRKNFARILLETNEFSFKDWKIRDVTDNPMQERIEPTKLKQDFANKEAQTNSCSHLEVIKEKEELRKEIRSIVCRELKDELLKELKEFVSKEIKEIANTKLKEFVSEEINEELSKRMKNIAFQNFNETLYKDL